jgi:phosphinothricin N-acetyltransferase
MFFRKARSLRKFGFTRWGELPEVCDMGGKLKNLTIPGKNLN